MVRFAEKNIRPLLGVEGTARRLNRVFPENRRRNRLVDMLARDEPVTTARTPQARRRPAERGAATATPPPPDATQPTSGATNTGGVVRQWVSELTAGTRPGVNGEGTVRAPSDSEIETLTAMFPDVGREVVLGVLQRRYPSAVRAQG